MQNNELQEVLSTALAICQEYNLPEVCTNALLYAVIDHVNHSGFTALVNSGVNPYALKIAIAANINKSTIPTKLSETPYSNALLGLLHLNGYGNNTSLHLVKTILKNSNTAAARLLQREHVYLNNYNQIKVRNF